MFCGISKTIYKNGLKDKDKLTLGDSALIL